ncbi:ankyrin repeat family protein [Euphorbia peplus]|nr:ankyrin repeat family protein [Euphorbia peplus]
MDPKIFKAVATGDVKYLKNLSQGEWDEFGQMKSHHGNTILHIAVQYQKLLTARIIIKKCKSLLHEQNFNGDTPLHLAVRNKFFLGIRMVRLLIQGDNERKRLVCIGNLKGDTALHEAVRSNNLKAVELLINEDEGLTCVNNNEGDSPIFIAVDKSFYRIARHILKAAPTCSFAGRKDMNVLHAVVIRSKQNFIRAVHKRSSSSISQADQFGWIPLHYAAYAGNIQVVELLLKIDKSETLLRMKDNEGMSALHIAAKGNQTYLIKKLTEKYPYTKEYVDNKGRTAFHVAAEDGKVNVVTYFKRHSVFNDIINEGDINGNTPLHLAALHKKIAVCNLLISHSRVDLKATNNVGLTAIDIIKSEDIISLKRLSKYVQLQSLEHFVPREKITEDQESPKLQGIQYEETSSIHNEIVKAEDHIRKPKHAPTHYKELANINLIIATIVATVTFTAAVTVPGGYNSDSQDEHAAGTAILTEKAAFQAFVIANSVAFGFSTALLTLRFWYAIARKDEHAKTVLKWSLMFRNWAVFAMVVAFLAGQYAVLSNSRGLAAAAVTVACFAFSAPALAIFWDKPIFTLVD